MASVIHHRITVHVYNQMIDAGILTEDDPVELINGEIVKKMPIGKLHESTVNRLNDRLMTLFAGQVIVSVQNSIVLDDSEPQPDVSVLVRRPDFYATAKPTATNVFLLVEVADSSLEYDREIKLPIYAQNSIQDFWIVNLIESRIEVYRQPQADGTYAQRIDYVSGQALNLLAFPKVQITVDELFG